MSATHQTPPTSRTRHILTRTGGAPPSVCDRHVLTSRHYRGLSIDDGQNGACLAATRRRPDIPERHHIDAASAAEQIPEPAHEESQPIPVLRLHPQNKGNDRSPILAPTRRRATEPAAEPSCTRAHSSCARPCSTDGRPPNCGQTASTYGRKIRSPQLVTGEEHGCDPDPHRHSSSGAGPCPARTAFPGVGESASRSVPIRHDHPCHASSSS